MCAISILYRLQVSCDCSWQTEVPNRHGGSSERWHFRTSVSVLQLRNLFQNSAGQDSVGPWDVLVPRQYTVLSTCDTGMTGQGEGCLNRHPLCSNHTPTVPLALASEGRRETRQCWPVRLSLLPKSGWPCPGLHTGSPARAVHRGQTWLRFFPHCPWTRTLVG